MSTTRIEGMNLGRQFMNALPPTPRNSSTADLQADVEKLAIENGRTVSRPITILGIAGSLRQNSYNKLLLKAASKILPPSTRLEIFEIDRIPLYNQDVEATAFPEEV